MPTLYSLIVLLSFAFFTIPTDLSVECSTPSFSAGNFNVEAGYALVGNTTSNRTARDFVDCAFACSAETRCRSFNFGKSPSENQFACEISDSVKAWDPQNFQSRPGFDYYSIADRLVIHPCLSSPCQNGGTCVEYKGKYTCKCPLEIGVLPYIDDKCNVQRSLILVTGTFNGVFGTSVKGHRYALDFFEAERLCQLSGATLASYNQLYRAWTANFQWCSRGWLADASVRYPMQEVRGGCGGRATIIGSSTQRDKAERHNALCYKSSL